CGKPSTSSNKSAGSAKNAPAWSPSKPPAAPLSSAPTTKDSTTHPFGKTPTQSPGESASPAQSVTSSCSAQSANPTASQSPSTTMKSSSPAMKSHTPKAS